jgi:opacity protein-like surface antigen
MGMKRLISIIFCFTIISVSQAQNFNAALLVGANFSQIDGDQFAGYNKLGANLGIEISRAVKEDWEASFEIKFSMKGSKKVIDPESLEPTLKISYHYAEVPLLVKYVGFKDIDLLGGVSLGVNVFNERDDNGIVTEEDELNKSEMALVLGGSYYFTDNLAVELRHGYSLLSIRDYPIIVNSPTWFGRAGWYNRLFTVGLRYQLGN